VLISALTPWVPFGAKESRPSKAYEGLRRPTKKMRVDKNGQLSENCEVALTFRIARFSASLIPPWPRFMTVWKQLAYLDNEPKLAFQLESLFTAAFKTLFSTYSSRMLELLYLMDD